MGTVIAMYFDHIGYEFQSFIEAGFHRKGIFPGSGGTFFKDVPLKDRFVRING